MDHAEYERSFLDTLSERCSIEDEVGDIDDHECAPPPPQLLPTAMILLTGYYGFLPTGCKIVNSVQATDGCPRSPSGLTLELQ